MMRSLFFALYGALLYPLARTLMSLAATKNEKLRLGLDMRKMKANGVLPWLDHPAHTRPFWIHCASGEFEYAKPVITRLKVRRPDIPILVTYFSPSVAKSAHSHPDVDFATPTPWDTARHWREFIEHHQPRAVLIARTDTWPEMLRQVTKAKVPSLLFSATLVAGSGRMKGLGRWITRISLQFLQRIYCVAESDLINFKSMGLENNVSVEGDTRFDQVLARLSQPKPIKEELFADKSPDNILVAGSTWAQDEEILVRLARRFSTRLNFIFVPHEPTEEHLQKLEKEIRNLGLGSVRYSAAESWKPGQVLLVDRIGLLAELYLKGRLAFVGGSFRKTVHSVMEPLGAGAITFVGPLHQNNREALEFSQVRSKDEFTCVEVVRDSDKFLERLDLVVSRKVANPDTSTRIMNEVQARSGRSDRVVSWALNQCSNLDSIE